MKTTRLVDIMDNLISIKKNKMNIIIIISLILISLPTELNGQIIRRLTGDISFEKSIELLREEERLRSIFPIEDIALPIVIPVVFHVVHDNLQSWNVTDDQIIAQLAKLNWGFRNTNIRFSFSQIKRHFNTTWSNHEYIQEDPSDGEIDMKQTLHIYPESVLNFYICALQPNLLGYARFPWDYPENSYMHGVVINYRTLPHPNNPPLPNFNLGHTAIHEIGHYLGLFHTFQNGCTEPGDHVDDTPYEFYDVVNNLTFSECEVRNTCPSLPGDDPIHNFMNYTYDDCLEEFTYLQYIRMREQLQWYRPTLTSLDVIVNQKRENDVIIQNSTVYRWFSGLNIFDGFPTPGQINTSAFTTETLRGLQDIIIDPYEKYNHWKVNNNIVNDITNHHSFSIIPSTAVLTSQFIKTYNNIKINNKAEAGNIFDFGNVQFKDPWLIDYPDPLFGNNLRNRGMKETGNDKLEFKSRPSPFYPNYTTNYNGDVYKGVFLNQGYNPVTNVWTPPYYSVQALSSEEEFELNQTGQRHKFYFQNWTSNIINNQPAAVFQYPSSLSTPVVFKEDGAEASAFYKGTQLSADEAAFWYNNQRKFVRTPDGYFHMVYESDGKIYYETKHENDEAWSLMNNGTALGVGKDPSISFCSYPYIPQSLIETTVCEVFIVFDQPVSNNQVIKLYRFRLNPDWEDHYTLQQSIDAAGVEQSSTNSCWAQLAVHSNNTISLVWKKSFSGDYNLRLRRGVFSIGNGIEMSGGYYGTVLSGTSNALHHSIAASKTGSSQLHLVWETRSGSQPTTGTIWYSKILNADAIPEPISVQNISQYNGCIDNSNPSIIARGEGARVVWKGLIDEEPKYEKINAGNEVEEYNSVIVFRDPGFQYFWIFGNNTGKPIINQAEVDPYYAFAWSENYGSVNKFADNSLSTIRTVGTYGNNLQMSGGDYQSDIFVSAHAVNDNVYFFNQSGEIGGLYKQQAVPISQGRQGVVGIDSAQFYYMFGDVEINGTFVDFIEVADTVNVTTYNELNKYLVSVSFNLTDNTNFTYSVLYGVTDSASAYQVLQQNNLNINFKVELIDNADNSVIGVFDNITLNSGNIIRYKNIAYQVNTTGIGNRSVHLRLVITPSAECNYSLGDRIAEWNILNKRNFVNTSFKGLLAVTEYALSQNYPNPFNPVTTINYQIPKDGFVSLKVYDILGKEIVTLVNSDKVQGSYTVEFDGSRFASGMYIYKLQSGDFVETRKMMLLK